MRIISGTMRGKRLITLEGDAVRPTSDRVKEALFDILQFRVEGRRFLDLFAGSGQIGLEAISRGAAQAVLVDASQESRRVIEQNVASLGFGDRARVVPASFAGFLQGCGERFDIAFLDPPYHAGLLDEALALTAACMAPGGIILCEHPKGQALPEEAGGFCKYREYRYGKVMLTSYQAPAADGTPPEGDGL